LEVRVRVDIYTRGVLTVIAIALVYLCVVLTPLPAVSAQYAARPGDDTGPAKVVVVGWQAADHVPVTVVDSITLKTMGDVRVSGTVQTEQKPNSAERVVLIGWEERASENQHGMPNQFDSTGTAFRGIPVATPREPR
jgi:hypothetical protein